VSFAKSIVDLCDNAINFFGILNVNGNVTEKYQFGIVAVTIVPVDWIKEVESQVARNCNEFDAGNWGNVDLSGL
jgi:hypothetical protein